MGNYKIRRILPALAVIIMTGCGKSGTAESDRPNFIVQDVQTVAKSGSSDETAADAAVSEAHEAPETPLSNDGALQQNGVSTVQEDITDMENSGGADKMTADKIKSLKAQTIIELQGMDEAEINACFSYEEVPDEVFERMKGKSYGEDCNVPLSELRYVRVLHYGFDGQVHVGELVVNQAIAQDITDIFKELFDAKYPIEKMVLIDEYDGDDDASMADNNTSSFNFRLVEGTSTLSKHAFGLAIDINPLYNPYIPERAGVTEVLPVNAGEYTDRTTGCEYYILHGDICYQAFISRGFTWGGDWNVSKDYQHFSKVIE